MTYIPIWGQGHFGVVILNRCAAAYYSHSRFARFAANLPRLIFLAKVIQIIALYL